MSLPDSLTYFALGMTTFTAAIESRDQPAHVCQSPLPKPFLICESRSQLPTQPEAVLEVILQALTVTSSKKHTLTRQLLSSPCYRGQGNILARITRDCGPPPVEGDATPFSQTDTGNIELQ